MVCAVLFQFTTALVLKELPLTVKVKPGSPCFAVLGMICAITGTISPLELNSRYCRSFIYVGPSFGRRWGRQLSV